jgi:flagellar assembly factor FliW
MLIHTVNFGDLEVPEDRVITFKEGLPGFAQINRFAVLELDELKPFRYLQALDDPPIALYIISPFIVDSAYEIQLTESDVEDIGSANSGELTVYAVATIPDDPREATLNLMAPIVINERERRGKQVVLLESGYSVRHPLFGSSNDGETKAQEC